MLCLHHLAWLRSFSSVQLKWQHYLKQHESVMASLMVVVLRHCDFSLLLRSREQNSPRHVKLWSSSGKCSPPLSAGFKLFEIVEAVFPPFSSFTTPLNRAVECEWSWDVFLCAEERYHPPKCQNACWGWRVRRVRRWGGGRVWCIWGILVCDWLLPLWNTPYIIKQWLYIWLFFPEGRVGLSVFLLMPVTHDPHPPTPHHEETLGVTT